MSNLLKHAQIVCFTIDALLQVFSRKSRLAQLFKGMTFRLIVGDECHQSDLRVFAAVALFTQTLLVLMDEDQAIDFSRPADRIVQRAERLPGEYWSWQRSISRRSRLTQPLLGGPTNRGKVLRRFFEAS